MFYIILKILVPLLILSTIATFADAICCPPYCKCSVAIDLKYVNDSEQKLINVELDIPKSVQWLDLSNNSISLLRDNIFQELGLQRIMVLNLNNNAIKDVGLNAFNGLKYIKFIDLSGNRLNKVDPATFKNNPSLTYLILSRNPLRNIPWYPPFLISSSLQNLEMSHCGFRDFPGETFALLPSLSYLNISNNKILMLPENVLNFLKNLRVLDISNTSIKCSSHTRYLFHKGPEKPTEILGSPCSRYSPIIDQFSKLNKEQLYKEQLYKEIIGKMIMPGISSEITSNSSEECRCPEIVEDFEENSVETIRPAEIPESRKFFQHEDRKMIWLVFFYALIIGAALSTSAILFCIYCCKYRNLSNNRRLPQRPAQCNNIPNETHEFPPPSCTDSQRPAQCNNIPNETHETLPSSYTDPQRPAKCNNIPNETLPPSYTDLFMVC